ncbi:rRNA-processing protein EFG1 [Emergomyces pasteurianus Ep9510]|uniref:rRNA-processing protein EFG1 n=1 Tax=Emergomyces pasteurianus Ep9510 TaxID=1447872 RepID=A0A1J9PNR7_9EURO|nr:rRNA-processing protein EFG1 [Emergomyces pasteurianus Ep9510]
MASLRKLEKRKDRGDDSISFEVSKLHRGHNRDSREASPRARNELDDRRKYRDRKESDSKPGKEPSNIPRIHDPNPYGDAQSKRDDRARTTGRPPVKPFRSRDVDLPSASELKNKIRDIKRLLNRADHLPADVRIEKERALMGYERDLEIVESRKNRAAMIKKYHFVRFLERKAATRQLSKLYRQKKTLTESNPNPNKEELNALEQQIYVTQVDLNYAIYCPLTEKYISLYPNQRRDTHPPEPGTEESNVIRNNAGEKPPLWYTVEQSMKDDTLEMLRDGKLGIGISGQNKTANSKSLVVLGRKNDTVNGQSLITETGIMKKHGKKKEKGKLQDNKKEESKKNARTRMDLHMDDKHNGDESDGGFFEE